MRSLFSPLLCAALLGTFIIENPQCGYYRNNHAQQALAFLEQGRYDQALVQIRRALRLRPDDASLHLLAALAHLGRDEGQAALEAAAEALRRAPDDRRAHATLRDICQQENRYEQARALLESLLADHPDQAPLLASLGWVYGHLEQDDKAIDLFRQALARSGDDLFAHVQLGRLYLRQERFSEAEAILQQALALEPDNQQLLLVLGDCQLRQERDRAADSTFAQAVQNSAAPGELASRIAQLYYERGRRLQAIAYYERALAHRPQDAFVLNNLAWTCAEEGIRLDYSLDLSLQAVKLEPDNVVYLDTYAELFYLKGQYERAVALMRRALELEPEGGEHHGYLQQQMEKFRQRQARL